MGYAMAHLQYIQGAGHRGQVATKGSDMTKFVTFFTGVALAATLGLANMHSASADPLAQTEGRSIDLGRGVHGTAYYIAERDGGYRVVATLDFGPGSTPVRFKAVLADGQSLEFSTPREVGQQTQTVSIHRTGDRMSVSNSGGPEIN